jgi:hypothetical protein
MDKLLAEYNPTPLILECIRLRALGTVVAKIALVMGAPEGTVSNNLRYCYYRMCAQQGREVLHRCIVGERLTREDMAECYRWFVLRLAVQRVDGRGAYANWRDWLDAL